MKTRHKIIVQRISEKPVDIEGDGAVKSRKTIRSLSEVDKSKLSPSRESEREMFWNSPFYKPVSKICDDAWDEFMHTAKMLLILEANGLRDPKSSPEYRELDVYAVFNKWRQDLHDELPYSKKFIADIDKAVEREFVRDRATSRNLV